MRKNIAYNEGISLPPANRDKVDYILFDLKQAYCDYYATSMIVMLRSLGIPARLAAGYARGRPETLDDQRIAYMVQNKDAHSWVEVFFPTYGWVEFEPTAAQPAIDRLTNRDRNGNAGISAPADEFSPIDRARDVQAEGDLTAPTPEPPAVQFALPFWGNISLPAGSTRVVGIAFGWMLGLGAVAIAAWYALKRLRLVGGTSSTPDAPNAPSVSAVYAALVRLANWMGIKKRPWQTVYEHASQIERAVPEASAEIEFISAIYVRQTFSPHPKEDTAIRTQVIQAWEKIRPLLFRTMFEKRNPLRKIRLPFRW